MTLEVTPTKWYDVKVSVMADFLIVELTKTMATNSHVRHHTEDFMCDIHKAKSRGLIGALLKSYDQAPNKIVELIRILNKLSEI